MSYKPHLTIFKDLSAVKFEGGVSKEAKDLEGAKVLHVADIITEAASYERAWIPAVKTLGGLISESLVVIDRKQGGAEALAKIGVRSHALAGIDRELFDMAAALGYINDKQHDMLESYLADPKKAMRAFLDAHPEFINNTLKSNTKDRERALLCLEKDFYSVAERYKA
jgi:hypothetical protein